MKFAAGGTDRWRHITDWNMKHRNWKPKGSDLIYGVLYKIHFVTHDAVVKHVLEKIWNEIMKLHLKFEGFCW